MLERHRTDEALRVSIERLSHPDSEVRTLAAQALTQHTTLGTLPSELFLKLLFEERDLAAKRRLTAALSSLPLADAEKLVALAVCISDSRLEVQREALLTLRSLGRAAMPLLWPLSGIALTPSGNAALALNTVKSLDRDVERVITRCRPTVQSWNREGIVEFIRSMDGIGISNKIPILCLPPEFALLCMYRFPGRLEVPALRVRQQIDRMTLDQQVLVEPALVSVAARGTAEHKTLALQSIGRCSQPLGIAGTTFLNSLSLSHDVPKQVRDAAFSALMTRST